MTAWHDQQPLSRKQVRNSQREAEADAVFSAARIQTEEAPFGGFTSTLPDASGAEESDQLEASETPTVSITVVPGGRRAQRLAAEAAASQGDGSFRVREFRAREEPSAESAQAGHTDSALSFAPLRPSMPEGLPSALAFLPSANAFAAEPPAVDLAPVAAPAPSADAVEPAPAVEAAEPLPEAAPDVAPGRPLTRRELRALEVARATDVETAPAESGPSFAPPILFTPASETPVEAPAELLASDDAPAVASPIFNAPIAFDAPIAEAPAPDAAAALTSAFGRGVAVSEPKFDLSAPPEAPVVLGNLAPPTGVPLGTSPTEIPTLASLLAPADPPVVPHNPLVEAPFVPQFSLADYPAPTPLTDAIASDRGVDVVAAPHSAPVGHWTMQQAIDDITQGGTATTSRDLSTATGPITSSALVMPSIPTGADLSVPFATTTGEVLITGSISLPSTLGTTGAHPARYDHSDLDAIIDAADRDDIEGDSAPVRAIRAVSTHTSPRDVISMSRKSEGNRLPIVLAITAGAMMVSVTVLVVVGFVFGAF